MEAHNTAARSDVPRPSPPYALARLEFRRQLRRLGFQTYDDYLRSPHWRDVKARFRADSRPQNCHCCGEAETALHHRTYARVGAERLDDLVPLCRRCHTFVHILVRRGELAIDLDGLLDGIRASRYSVEQQDLRRRAELENTLVRREEDARARSIAIRAKEAVLRGDASAMLAIADEMTRFRDARSL